MTAPITPKTIVSELKRDSTRATAPSSSCGRGRASRRIRRSQAENASRGQRYSSARGLEVLIEIVHWADVLVHGYAVLQPVPADGR